MMRLATMIELDCSEAVSSLQDGPRLDRGECDTSLEYWHYLTRRQRRLNLAWVVEIFALGFPSIAINFQLAHPLVLRIDLYHMKNCPNSYVSPIVAREILQVQSIQSIL